MIINALEKSVQIKIVYFGPALSGKTASLKYLFDHFGLKEQVRSIESTEGKTLFYDYGVLNFEGSEWKLKIHAYSTTGQSFYRITRPVTIKAADALIFVIDSQKSSYEQNLASWDELLSYYGKELEKIPIALAFNKQDVFDKFEISSFLHEIKSKNFTNIIVTKTIALNGEGILSTFEKILCNVFKNSFNM